MESLTWEARRVEGAGRDGAKTEEGLGLATPKHHINRIVRYVPAVIMAALVLGLSLLIVPGCSGKSAQDPENGIAGTLVIRGSDTMVNLTAAWAQGFMSANKQAQISVQGGGSSTGFAALVDGSTDLATASRPIKDTERKALQDKGKTVVEMVVAFDAVTIVVNAANSITDLTLAQLADILTGKITNWKEVGGSDRAITVYSRESSSGTYAFVQEKVMGGADYVASARLMPSTESIVQAVAQDKTAIGYVGLGYVIDAIKVLGVAKDAQSPSVRPSVAAVLDETYPVARSLFVYSAGEPSPLGRAFIDFCLSPAGAGITAEIGFIPSGGR
jgi:phosphate transport system substrate-binding protein